MFHFFVYLWEEIVPMIFLVFETLSGNKKSLIGMPKEPLLEELPPDQDDDSMSFTPQIKYKKLAFKVRWEEWD